MDVAIFGASESIDETQDLSLFKFSNDTEVTQEPSLKMESTSYSPSSGDKEVPAAALKADLLYLLQFVSGYSHERKSSLFVCSFALIIF